MNKVGDTIIAIGDKITVTCYAIKYWLRGADWEDALTTAKNIVEAGWK
ncbi:hypothetical protein KA005_06755 [bacterium]|nr:hypothetical protein [bacterium]